MTYQEQIKLSDRERECLSLVAEGMTSKEISAILGTSPGVVDNHIQAAIRAMGAASRREAARIYVKSQVQQLHVQPQSLVNRGRSDDVEGPPVVLEEQSSNSHWSVRTLRAFGRFVRMVLGHVGGSRHGLRHRQVPVAIALASLLTSGILAATILIYYWLNHIFS
jgi:DNA-binding CsgD family transcriptional regulator